MRMVGSLRSSTTVTLVDIFSYSGLDQGIKIVEHIIWTFERSQVDVVEVCFNLFRQLGEKLTENHQTKQSLVSTET